MSQNCILKQLKNAIDNSSVLYAEYNTVTQNVVDGELQDITVTMDMQVDYSNQTAVSTMQMFSGSNTPYFERTTYQSDSKCTSQSSDANDIYIMMSKSQFNSLFLPGGELYPFNFEGLKPVRSKCDCSNNESYTYVIPKCTCFESPIDTLITVCMIKENLFKVTAEITAQTSGYTITTVNTIKIRTTA